MGRAAWVYLVAAGAAAVVYLAVPWGIVAIGTQYIAHELAAVTATVIAVRRRRTGSEVLWWLIAASLGIWAVGDVFWYSNAAAGMSPFPSQADGLYLVGYVGLAGALTWLAMTRQRGRQIGDLLDALLVTVGLGVPTWLLVVGPVWADASAGLGGQVIGTAYAVVVMALILLVSWSVIGGVTGTISGRLLVAGFVGLIAANLGYSITLLEGLYDPGAGLDAGWLAFFALTAAAALHPSMEELHRPAARLRASASPPRAVLVWAMASIPPLVILAAALTGETSTQLLTVAAIGTFLAVTLMAVRVLLLLEQTDIAARTEGQQRLAALIERIHDVITLHDGDGRVRYASPAVRHIWGHDQLDDPDLLDHLVHPEDRGAVHSVLTTLAHEPVGALRRLEVRVELADGSWRNVELTAVNHLPDPAIAGIVVTFHDVTARADNERFLRQHADQQTDIAEQLRRVQEMKDAFLSAVSHDLRTPLTSIRGMTELLTERGDSLGSDQRRLLIDRVAANAERLEQLLLELLDLDRLTRGIRRPERGVVDVTAIAEEVVAFDEFRDAPILLSGRCPAADVDATMIRSILHNLIGNAVKHTPASTSIWVQVAPLGDGGVRIVVEDAGRGIPEALRDHVLQAFTRLDESRSTPGNGLGLALVESFTRLHGGQLDVQERQGGGARFVADIPAYDATLPAATRPPSGSAMNA